MDLCSICLEQSDDDLTSCIEEKSLEWEKFKVTQIIKKHLWWWYKKNNTGDGSWICVYCWKNLLTFHKFYLQAQKQHNQYKDMIKVHSCNKINVNVNASTALPDKTMSEILFTDLDTKVEADEYPESDKNLTTDQFTTDVSVGADEYADSKGNLTTGKCTMDVNVEADEYPESEENSTTEKFTMDVKVEAYEYPDSDKQENYNCVFDDSKQSNSKIEKKVNASLRISKNSRISRNPVGIHKLSLTIAKKYDEYIAANFEIFCSLCATTSVPFANFYSLKLHFKLEHTGTQAFVTCCGLKISKRAMLVDHLKTHKDPETFKCQKCSKCFPHRRSLKYHMEYHDKPWECNLCFKAFGRLSSLKFHLNTHTGQTSDV